MDTNEKQLKTAVLFLTYKRLDTTKQIFEAIKKAKPQKIYISSNFGKNKEEVKKIIEVRTYLEENIDWKCKVSKLYRTRYLSAKLSISGAIDWFFKNEEQGIILEDDCLPSQSFFWFCEELLERYKKDMRVGQISGDNFQKEVKRGESDYYFSIYNHIWGWASWANRWKNYDVDLNSFDDAKFIEEVFDKKSNQKYWIDIFKKMKVKSIDTWDYQWTFALWKAKQLTILPNINLIENIGFGEGAAHTTKESEFANLKAYEMVLSKHPKTIERCIEADEFTTKIWFSKKSYIERVVNKIRRLIR